MNSDLGIAELLENQRQLQEKYKGVWSPICPEQGPYTLLWAMGEMGELIDIIKKKGGDAIMNDDAVRSEFKKEFADVLMYMGDLLACYSIDADEITKAYRAKHEYNMRRVYNGETHVEKADNEQ